MGERAIAKAETTNDGEVQPLQTFPVQYLHEGVRSGIFAPKGEAGSGMEFLKGFKLVGGAAGQETSISDTATPFERQQYIANQTNRLSTDVGSIWDKNNRVLAIGDEHLTVDIKKYTAKNMQAYHEQGAQAIGMELFQKSAQPDLDRYYDLRRDPSASPEKLKAAEQKVESLLRQSQESPDDTEAARQRAEPSVKKTMSIIDSAIDAGIRPIGIEPEIARPFADDAGYPRLHDAMAHISSSSQQAFDQYTSTTATDAERNASRQVLEKDLQALPQSAQYLSALDEARAAGFNFSGIKVPAPSDSDSDGQWYARLHDLRNRTWAETAAKYLGDNPNARMLLFAGSEHFRYVSSEELPIPSANERLKEKGIGSTVLQYAGGDFADPKNFNYEFDARSAFYSRLHGIQPDSNGNYPAAPDFVQCSDLRYSRAAKLAGAESEEFALRVGPGARQSDYVIHLPEHLSEE